MNTILIHPSYFPSIAQMTAIAQAKDIIFEIHDNYQKQTYRNRAYIAHSNGKLLLSVPVKHAKDGSRQKMAEVEVENEFPWQAHHWKSIQSAYRTSPFFEFYEDDLKELFTKPVTSLLEHNVRIHEILCDLLGLTVATSYTRSYEKNSKHTDLRNLINVKKEPKYPLQPYIQVLEENHGFLPNLSVLDLLFNEGTNALNYLESQEIFDDIL